MKEHHNIFLSQYAHEYWNWLFGLSLSNVKRLKRQNYKFGQSDTSNHETPSVYRGKWENL